MWDIVEVSFDDDTTTEIVVAADDLIEDTIAEICEAEGWDIKSVNGWQIIDTKDENTETIIWK